MNLGSGKRGFLTFKGDPLEDNIIAQPEAPVGMLIMGYRNRRRYRSGYTPLTSTTAGGKYRDLFELLWYSGDERLCSAHYDKY